MADIVQGFRGCEYLFRRLIDGMACTAELLTALCAQTPNFRADMPHRVRGLFASVNLARRAMVGLDRGMKELQHAVGKKRQKTARQGANAAARRMGRIPTLREPSV